MAGQEYDEKCDIWSAGVILYLLICGQPPFYGATKEVTIRLIKKGEVKFIGPIWKRVSAEAKAFIQRMLVLAPEKRISAHQARTHPWIINNCNKPTKLDKTIALPLENLRSFHTQHTLQTAALTFIASQLMDSEHEESLRRMFSVFDVDNDGQISKGELIVGYKALDMNTITAEKEVKEVFEHVDLNQNDNIDYNGTIDTGRDYC